MRLLAYNNVPYQKLLQEEGMAKSESNKTGEWWGDLWKLLIIWMIWQAIEGAWHSKFRYAVQYWVPYKQVTEPNQPHDCDWLTAPLGSKNCHYDPQVQTIRTATSTTGRPIVSFDDGKTWVINDRVPPLEPSVFITWTRVDD